MAVIEFEGLGENLLKGIQEATSATEKLRDESAKAGDAISKAAREGGAANQKAAADIEGTAQALQGVRKEVEKGGFREFFIGAKEGVKDAINEVGGLKGALSQLGVSGKKDLEKVEAESRVAAKSLQEIRKEIDLLNKKKVTLSDPKQIASINGQIGKLTGQYNVLNNAGVKAGSSIRATFNGVTQQLSSVVPQVGGIAGSLINALGPVGIAIGAIATGLLKVIANTDAGATALDGLGRTGGIVFDKITGKVTDFFTALSNSDSAVLRFTKKLADASSFILDKLIPVETVLRQIGLLDVFGDAVKEGQQLANVYDTIDDAQINLIRSNAANEREINKLNIQLRDRTKSDAERLAIGEKINKLETERARVEAQVLKASTAALRAKAAQEFRDSGQRKEVSDETKRLLAEAIAAEERAAQESESITERAQNRVNAVLDESQIEADARLTKDQARATQRAQIEDKLVADITAAQQQLATRLSAIQIEQADPRQRLDLQREAALEEVRILQRTLQEKIALQRIEQEVGAETFAKLSEAQKKARADALIDGGEVGLAVAQQEQITSLEIGVWQKYWDDRKEIDVTERTALLDLQQDGFEKEREQFDIELEARVEKLRENGATVLQIEAFIAEQREAFRTGQVAKAIDTEEQIALARIGAMQRGAESEATFRYRIELEKLAVQEEFAQQRLANLRDNDSDEATLIRLQLEGVLNEINAKREELKNSAPKQDLFDLLGLDLNGEEKASIIASLKDIGATIKGFLQEGLDAKRAALDAEAALNDERISEQQRIRDELQGQLDRELDLQRDGYANNADSIRQQIELTKITEAEALNEKKRIQAEQKALAKQQLAVDSAVQVSALITANAHLFAKGALAGPAGIIAAIAAGAALLATFISIKNKAKAINSDVPAFSKGTKYVRLGASPKGTDTIHARLDEGEAVVSAKNNKKYSALVDGIVEGDDNKVYEAAIRELLGNNIQLDDNRVTKIVRQKEVFMQQEVIHQNDGTEALRKEVKGLRADLAEFKEQERIRVREMDGATVTPTRKVKTR